MQTRRAIRDGSGTLVGCIYERAARGGSCARSYLDALVDANDDPWSIDADNDPCSRRGSGGQFLPPSTISYGPTLHFLRPQRGGEYLRWRLFDPNVIREGYNISSSIILSAHAAHETPRDNGPGYLCLNECMLGARVRIPFDFEVAEALRAFNIPPACVIPHSWKVIQMMAWYCEHRGCSADRYLWRELLTHQSSQGYVKFLARRDIKGIDNPLDCVPGWESRFFFAWLTSEGDIWGILNEEFFHWCKSACLAVAKEGERRALKRARSSEEEGNLADSDSSIEEAPGSSSSRQLTPMAELEGTAPPSIVAQLKEELEASHAKVARLQSILQGDVVRSSVVTKYLRSDAYRRWVEFEQAHHSRSGYVKALLDVATFYTEIDLSSLYRSP
ncbi:hypothetical protein ACLOJK_019262 [Asimina triloba]